MNNKNQFYLVDNNGTQYQIAITDRTKDNSGSGYVQQTLLPESKKDLWLGYEIPESTESYSLYYSPPLSQSVVKISLK